MTRKQVGAAVATVGALVLVLLPLRIGSFGEFVLSVGLVYIIVASALHLLVHWTGQLSFGHIAFAGIGGHTAAHFAARGWSVGPSIGLGVLASLVAGLLVGFPALRIRGFYLAIVTFALGYAVDRWLFQQPWLVGMSLEGNKVPRPRIFGRTLYDAGLYLSLLGCTAVVLLLLVRLRRTKAGHGMAALKASEELASSYGINVAAYKVLSFGVSSAIAGFGGALFVYALGVADRGTFPLKLSILFVSLVVIGGAGSVWGTVVVAASFGILPSLLGPGPAQWFDLIGPLLLLVVILQYPGGQNEAGRVFVRQILALIDRLTVREAKPGPAVRAVSREPLPVAAANGSVSETALAIENLSVHFGGVQALDGVGITVGGEGVTGLIGPNGAGKSTLLNCVSGFQRPDDGRIVLFGTDVSRLASHRRTRLGIGRTFQQLTLCRSETALENLMIAQHREAAYPALAGPLGLPSVRRTEQSLRESAEMTLERLGLTNVGARPVGDLPLGTAKLIQLACVLVERPQLLLLDEPTGGLSHGETERLQEILIELTGPGGLSVLLVSHDMRLIMSSADQIYVLNFGRVLAEGTPSEIRAHAGVVEAYLGTGARA